VINSAKLIVIFVEEDLLEPQKDGNLISGNADIADYGIEATQLVNISL